MKTSVFARVVVFAVLATAVSWAHDPYEITTEAWLRANTLELDATMARSTSMGVLSGSPESVPFDPEKFDELRPKFEKAAESLFTLTLDGKPLPVPKVRVGLTIENDLEIHLAYPRPAAGTLRVEAPHVGKLGYGYGNVFTAHGDKGALLEQRMLTSAEPALEFSIAPASATTPTPAPAAVTPKAAEKPAQPARVSITPKILLALGAVMIIGALVFILGRRSRKAPADQ